MMKIKFLVFSMLGMLTLLWTYWGWARFSADNDGVFECQARMHLPMAADTCQGDGLFDFFLALHSDGKGYLIIGGKYQCPNSAPVSVDSLVDFNYTREGVYHNIHLGPRNTEVKNIFSILKYNDIKLKITPLDKGIYILDLPLRTPMVCRTMS